MVMAVRIQTYHETLVPAADKNVAVALRNNLDGTADNSTSEDLAKEARVDWIHLFFQVLFLSFFFTTDVDFPTTS